MKSGLKNANRKKFKLTGSININGTRRKDS